MATQSGKSIEVVYADDSDRALALTIAQLCREADLAAEVRPAQHALPEMVIAVHPGAEREGLALLSLLERDLSCELAAAGVCLWIGGLPGTAFFELPHYAAKARFLLERVAAAAPAARSAAPPPSA